MTRTGVFFAVAASSVFGGVVGLYAVGKSPKRILGTVGWAPAFGTVLAAGLAAVLFEQTCPACPPCAPGTTVVNNNPPAGGQIATAPTAAPAALPIPR
jgi:hypothetical protein